MIQSADYKVIDFVRDKLYELGIKVVFAVPGAHIDLILKALVEDERFELVIACHEGGAGFMADGYSRSKEGPAAVITINGPGVSNLVTAAITSRIEKVPLLILTGDAVLRVKGMGGFQTSDILQTNTGELMKAAIEDVAMCESVSDVVNAFERFEQKIDQSLNTPSYINIPYDLHMEPCIVKRDISLKCKEVSLFEKNRFRCEEKIIVFLIGEEIRSKKDYEKISRFASKYHIPVAATLGGKQGISHIHEELRLGIFGYAGGPRGFAGLLDENADLVVMIGCSLNERNTYAWNRALMAKRIIKYSRKLEASDVYRNVEQYALKKVDDFLSEFQEATDLDSKDALYLRRRWMEDKLELHEYPINTNEAGKDSDNMSINDIIDIMNKRLPSDYSFFMDSGDHRIIAGSFWIPRKEGDFQTAGTTAPMGWAIGAGIGACFANHNKPVVVLTGDGCMQMHGMEVAVARRYNRKIIFIVSNNASYGRIAARLKPLDPKYCQNISDLPKISWCGYAESMGVKNYKVNSKNEMQAALSSAIEYAGPVLIEAITRSGENIPFSKGVFSSFNYTKE